MRMISDRPGRSPWRLFLLIFVLGLSFLPFSAFFVQGLRAGADAGSVWAVLASPSARSALGFSLLQASVSTVLALVFGLPGAYLVATYRFPGRKLLLSLSAVPFCLPPLLVILAFVLYYGREGWLSRGLALLGMNRKAYRGILYSFWGLVFVHAFYNFPLVVQNVGSLWVRLPRSREEAARTLGASRIKAFASGTLPYLLPSIAQSASLVFLFCFFSFTIVLVFGGLSGSTLEVGIYRALRFSDDKVAALALSLVQTGTALLVVLAFLSLDARTTRGGKGFGAVPPLSRPKNRAFVFIVLYEAVVCVFFLGPILALGLEAFTVRSSLAGGARLGLDNFAHLIRSPGSPLLVAVGNSLTLSGSAALAATAIGFFVGLAAKAPEVDAGSGSGRRRKILMGLVLTLPLALSSAVTAAGWASLFPQGGAFLVVLGQAAMTWPFVARFLSASFASLDPRKREAALALGARPVQATMLVELPVILPSVLGAAAFAFSMTMGDANIPLVLGGGRGETLPLLLYRLSSSYRFGDACAVGLVLAAFTGLAFFLKGGRDELS